MCWDHNGTVFFTEFQNREGECEGFHVQCNNIVKSLGQFKLLFFVSNIFYKLCLICKWMDCLNHNDFDIVIYKDRFYEDDFIRGLWWWWAKNRLVGIGSLFHMVRPFSRRSEVVGPYLDRQWPWSTRETLDLCWGNFNRLPQSSSLFYQGYNNHYNNKTCTRTCILSTWPRERFWEVSSTFKLRSAQLWKDVWCFTLFLQSAILLVLS